MATVECPECAKQIEVDDDLLGKMMKCPKCKSNFKAEKAGAYDLLEELYPSKTRTPAEPDADEPAVEKPRAKPKPKAKAKPETEAERKVRERLEKWAEAEDE